MPSLEPEKRGGKARLLKAAQFLIQGRSFDEITIEEIIREAGLSRPSFYYHFAGGKEELRQALVECGALLETPSQDVRQDILKAALCIYARSGISSATLEDIAAKARVTKSTLIWHFHSKEDLLCSILKEYGPSMSLRPAIEQIESDLQHGTLSGYETTLRKLAEAFYDAFNMQKDYTRLAILLVYTHPEIAQQISETLVSGRKIITDYVQKLQEEGYFRRDIDPGFLTQTMGMAFSMRAISRGLYSGKLPYNDLSRESMVEQVISLLLYGIVRREPAGTENE